MEGRGEGNSDTRVRVKENGRNRERRGVNGIRGEGENKCARAVDNGSARSIKLIFLVPGRRLLGRCKNNIIYSNGCGRVPTLLNPDYLRCDAQGMNQI